jgi:hypothetical protein
MSVACAAHGAKAATAIINQHRFTFPLPVLSPKQTSRNDVLEAIAIRTAVPNPVHGADFVLIALITGAISQAKA